MKYKIFIISLLIICCIAASSNAQNSFNPSAADIKVAELLSRMTLEEKIGQMVQFSDRSERIDDLVSSGLVGSLLNVTGAEEVNSVQELAVEQSPSGIPLIFGLDVIHGYRTIYPIPLAEAATWDPELVQRCAQMAAREASAAGINWTFAPMVDIARDARWGRISEGSGEDPYLGSVMAVARVRGFQGDNLADPQTMVACPKHFAAYGAAIAGKDYNTVDMSMLTLRNIYMPPFKAALDAGAGTIMCAFNEINGVPCSGNEWLLNKVLREEWGFEGFVVSDWASISEMLNHGNVADSAGAVYAALKAGVDMDMVSEIYLHHLLEMVKSGELPEEWIDKSAARILKVKVLLGLFDRPYVDPKRERQDIMTNENLKLAREAAQKSIVLLKNDEKLLPLNKDLKKLAVIGPLAKSQQDPLGWWHCEGQADEVVSVFDGIKKEIDKDTQIIYARGCSVDGDTTEFDAAVHAAESADAAILVVGESYDMSGEGASRSLIGLPGRQLELVQKIHKTGTPVVVVLMNGRPLALPWIAEHIPAILEIWQPGTQCGPAVADVLFGDVNPGGKLPVSFPRRVGQEPLFYNHKNTGRPPSENRFTSRYYDVEVTPQFPFGHGLSYTSFEYSNLQLDKMKIQPFGTLVVSADVKNAGSRSGEEIVQFYVRDLVGRVTRPVKELKGFRKISLKSGETKTVRFELLADELGYYNNKGQNTIEAGTFNVWIGPNSAEGLAGSFEIIEN